VYEQRNIIVDDVSKRDNYLACSLETKSELVVLIRHDGQIVGQFDIDGHEVAAFTTADEQFLALLAAYVSKQCMLECKRMESRISSFNTPNV
jgi:GAF domain-containing protein